MKILLVNPTGHKMGMDHFLKAPPLGLMILAVAAGIHAKEQELLNISLVDSFAVMRESEKGKVVGKDLEELRESMSAEIRSEAQKIALEDKEIKSKASTMKKDVSSE